LSKKIKHKQHDTVDTNHKISSDKRKNMVLTVTMMMMLMMMMTFFLTQTMKNKSEKTINGKNEKLERSCNCNFSKGETEEYEWR
jgi:hypothetical protein